LVAWSAAPSYALLETASHDDAERAQLRERLDELSLPFSDNPAFVAFLEMKRHAAGL